VGRFATEAGKPRPLRIVTTRRSSASKQSWCDVDPSCNDWTEKMQSYEAGRYSGALGRAGLNAGPRLRLGVVVGRARATPTRRCLVERGPAPNVAWRTRALKAALR